MSDTQKKALKGSAWTIVGYGGAQVIRLGSNLILAHLLFPAAFGLMALVGVFMQGLQMFSEVGLGPSIIQNKRGDDPDFLNTAWTIQVVRGFILWAAACLLAWPAAEFFGRSDPMADQLLTILPVIGFSSVLGGLASTSLYTLNRHLKIAQLTLMELIPQIVSVAVTIVWAWWTRDVWALVGGWMAYSVVRLVMSHWMDRTVRNRFRWDPISAKELLRFGLWIFLGTVVAFFANSLDRLLLGRLLTLQELGIYSISLTFSRVGIEVATRLSNTVLFPILARSQDNPARLVAKSLQARSLILLAGGALVCGFAILAPIFFETLYDQRYAAAGEISRWLAIYVWCCIMLSSMERVPLALGHGNSLVVANLVSTAGYALAIPGYFWYGLPGFILGNAAGSVAAHVVLLAWVPVKRLVMLGQTGIFTAAFGIYGGFAVWWMISLDGNSSPLASISAGLGATILPCVAAGWLGWRQLRRLRQS